MQELSFLLVSTDKKGQDDYGKFITSLKFPQSRITQASSLEEFYSVYQDQLIHGAIIWDNLGKEGLTDILRELRSYYPHCFIALETGTDDLGTINALLQTGVDYFLPNNPPQRALNDVVNKTQEAANRIYRRALFSSQDGGAQTDNDPVQKLRSSDFIVASEPMEKIWEKIHRVAPSDATVFIQGESGTGKEVIARALHSMSLRSNKPFVELNIAALPESLMESELFGYKKGAFTGADHDRKGRFEEAEGGTLFIDEIGEIPVQVQVKLLRVLQFRTIQRVGENLSRPVNVRILAATSRDIKAMIQDGTYREDLFYRLAVVSIQVPALRERRADILPLIEHFIKAKGTQYGKENLRLQESVYPLLSNLTFPGNIRELENIIEHMVIMCRGNLLTPYDLPEYIPLGEVQTGSDPAPPDQEWDKWLTPGRHQLDSVLERVEITMITKALEQVEGNQSRAAELLGISERRLRSRMTILSLENSYRQKDGS